MIKIKICGVTNPKDAHIVASSGADALGLIFYHKSPRNIDIQTAQSIINSLPPFITTVALFCNPSLHQVQEVISQISFDCLQFHGEEEAEFCEQFKLKYIKAIPVKNTEKLINQINSYATASAILLDTFSVTAKGGTGKNFDWSLIPSKADKPLIIAGGINQHNIKNLLVEHTPYAIDVSSGVEENNAPGIKSHTKIIDLMEQFKQFRYHSSF